MLLLVILILLTKHIGTLLDFILCVDFSKKSGNITHRSTLLTWFPSLEVNFSYIFSVHCVGQYNLYRGGKARRFYDRGNF